MQTEALEAWGEMVDKAWLPILELSVHKKFSLSPDKV